MIIFGGDLNAVHEVSVYLTCSPYIDVTDILGEWAGQPGGVTSGLELF